MGSIMVVGVGYWGPNLIRNFMAIGAYDEVIACDVDRGRLETVGKQFPGLVTCEAFGEALDRPGLEAVVIAAPVRLHYELAKAALSAGKHVLIEKPLTQTSQQGRELVDLAGQQGVTLMVDHTFIYTGAVEKIAEIVAGVDLGEFYYVDSVRVNLGLFQEDVDVIWDLAPHDLSIVNHVLKRPPKVVRAIGHSHAAGGLVDVAYLNVEYGDNIAANFHVSWLSPTKIRRMMFSGSRRMIVWNDLDQAEKIRVYDKGVELQRVNREGKYSLKVGYRVGDAWLPQVDGTEALRKMAAHFVDCCRNGKTPATSGQDGLDVVRVLEASSLSLSNGGQAVSIEGEEPVLGSYEPISGEVHAHAKSG